MADGWYTIRNYKSRRMSHYFENNNTLCNRFEMPVWIIFEPKDTHRHCELCEVTLKNKPRDKEIRRRRANGEQVKVLASEYGLSNERISAITRAVSTRKLRSDKK